MSRYFQASTANPTGHRPWNFAMQQKPGLGRLRGRSGLGRMGVNLLSLLPASAQQQATAIIQYLRQAQADINATNQALIQGTAQGIDMSDLAAQNNSAQQQLNTLQSEFTDGYRAMTGSVPPGLSGLGQVDPASWATIAGAAAALAILAAAAYALIQYTSSLRANAQARITSSQTAAAATQQAIALQNQAVTACAAGDASCATLTALAQQASGNIQPAAQPGATNWTTWVQNNAVIIGLVFAGVILVPKILRKI
jgi:hypothetical protein